MQILKKSYYVTVLKKKEFDNEPVDYKQSLKNKITSHGDEVTDFLW